MAMWIYQNSEFTEDQINAHIGFVYIIKNLQTGRCYIGKKLFWFSKTRTIKGKKKREKVLSDWPKYWSSSEELVGDVEKHGEENFTREILYLCGSKGALNYMELREQILRNVLVKPDEWYNGFVGGRIHRSHVIGKLPIEL